MKLCSSSSSRPSSGGGGGGGGDSMGVDHRETREGGGISPGPKIWSRKDANAKCPPSDFVMFQNFKHQIVQSISI